MDPSSRLRDDATPLPPWHGVGPERGALADRVYAELKARMLDFRLVPGDRFSELEMGRTLGVSRTPVREALFRLRSEGLLDVESKTGWFVRPIDFRRIDQLYELRVVLEQACVARLASASTVSTALDTLKTVWLVPPAERLRDGREVGLLDERFHATLVEAAGNVELARVHADVTERIRIVRRLDFTRHDRIEATYAEHGKILRQVLQRKPEAAQSLLKAHIEVSRAEVRKITLATLHEVRLQGPASRAEPAA